MIVVGKNKQQTSKSSMKCTSSARLYSISEDIVPVQVLCVVIFFFLTKQSSNTRNLIFPSYFADMLPVMVRFILYSIDTTHYFFKIKRWSIWNGNCWQTKMVDNTQDISAQGRGGTRSRRVRESDVSCLSVWLWQMHFIRSQRTGYYARLWHLFAVWPQTSYFTSLDLKLLIPKMREI